MGGAWITPFFIHPTGHDTLYSVNHDIWRYPHDTYPLNNWQQITNDLSPVLVTAFVQSQTNPEHMILSGSGGEDNWPSPYPYFPVMISTDGGYSWMDVTDNIPGETHWIPQVVTHPDQENTMYIVRCGFSDGNKIYKTTDLGETWTNVSGDLPDIPCNDLFIDPENTNHYYAGTDLGVYFSEDEGENWIYASDGMPKVPVIDFDYVKIENTRYLRLATFGRSIYETTDLVTDIRGNNMLSKGSIIAKPNPFSTKITLDYELQQSSNVQLSIYNHIGEKVMDLVNEHQVKGKHQFNLNGTTLATGIYFCVLKTNEGIQTRKMVKVE